MILLQARQAATCKITYLLRIRRFDIMTSIKDYIQTDQEIFVFKGTRVPIETLFLHLEKGISLNEFLEDFPTVSKEQAVAVLGIAEKLMTSKNIERLYETAACRKLTEAAKA
jgi:uncharacterized protein (DUF433 family)